MPEFHFGSQDNDPIIFQQEEILNLMQELREIINEIGIEEFNKRTERALNINLKKYKPGKSCKYIK